MHLRGFQCFQHFGIILLCCMKACYPAKEPSTWLETLKQCRYALVEYVISILLNKQSREYYRGFDQ